MELLSLDDPAPPRAKSGLRVALVLGALGVVAVGCAVGYFSLADKGDKPRATPTASSPPPGAPQPPAEQPQQPTPGLAKTQSMTTRPTFLPEPAPRELSGDEVYEGLLKSTTLIFVATDRSVGWGSGVLVDRKRRLVVTNEHVVGATKKTIVFFPAHNQQKELISDLNYYDENVKRIGIVAEVVRVSARQDLALLQLESLPSDARTVAIAAGPAKVGTRVYSVGGSGVKDDGLLWRLTSGTVRSRKRFKIGIQEYNSLETDAAINKGDSGGPVVNDRGELVAVVSSYRTNQRSVSDNVDVSELRTFIGSYFASTGSTWVEERSTASSAKAPPTAVLANLLAVLKDGTPGDQVEAARRLGKLADQAKSAIPALLAVLDTSDSELSAAATAALNQIGTPVAGQEAVLLKALASRSTAARAYAAGQFASEISVPADGIKGLRDALSDPSPSVRVLVARAIARSGSATCRDALGALLTRLADDDPATREAAAAAIKAMGPAMESDRRVLVEQLRHTSAGVRSVAADLLATVTTAEDIKPVWVPLLKDRDAAIRRAAVQRISLPPEGLAGVERDVLGLLPDPDASVRTAVAAALQHMQGTAGVVDQIQKQLLKETDEAVRVTLSLSLLGLAPNDASDLPAVRRLLKDTSPQVREAAANKIRTIGADAAPAAPDLIERASDPAPAVQVAALQAFVATGSRSKDALPAFTKLLERHKSQEGSERLLGALVGALGSCGADGIKVIEEHAQTNLPASVKEQMCLALAAQKSVAEPTVIWMVDLCEGSPACREAVAASVAAHGSNTLLLALIKRTDVYKPRKASEPESQYPADYRAWVISVLRKIDVPKVAARSSQEAVRSRLAYMVEHDKSKDVVSEARAALSKFGW